MNVLVAAASKYGATAEIAAAVAQHLRDRGMAVALLPMDAVDSVEGYDAVILGSAVYMGRWRSSAREMVADRAAELRKRPVWLFSSGPTGDTSRPAEDPVDVKEIVLLTNARGHRLFGGRLERSRLGFADRAVVMALRAADGDFRPWGEIKAWTEDIAEALAEGAVPGHVAARG